MNIGKLVLTWCMIVSLHCGYSLMVLGQSSTISNLGPVLFAKDSIVSTIPRCPKVNDAFYTYETPTTIKLTWDDLPAVANQLEYEIRFKRTESRESWKYVNIYAGNNFLLERVKPEHHYSFEIRKLCYNGGLDFKLESEWSELRPFNVRTSEDGICDSLGQIQVLPDNNIGIYTTVPQHIWQEIASLECNIIFEVSYCGLVNGNVACRPMHWIYDNSSYKNFTSDLERLYPTFTWDSTSTPYLRYVKVSKYCVLDSNDISIFDLGDVYGSFGWDSLNVEGECTDSLIFTVPGTNNPNCGVEFEIPGISGGTLASAQVGDTFTIAGYPLVLTSVSGSSGVFSGEANVTLPWQQTELTVPFSSVSVNAKKQITSGEIELSSYPLFDPDDVGEFQIGGQICLPSSEPESYDSTGNHSVTGLPWDERGFGSDSTYSKDPPYDGYQDGDPYDPNFDPNGFGFDSIHVNTGTIYNEYGCSQAGIDSLGQPCNPTGPGPYYWLNTDPSGPPTEEGIQFANEIQDTLEALIVSLISIMSASLEDSISNQRTLCGGIRYTMDNVLTTLAYDRDFIYGENDEYYAEGMSLNFNAEPKPFQVSMDRDANTVILENKHIELYQCDKKLTILLRILEILSDLQEGDELDEFINNLLEKVKRFDSNQVEQYSDINELLTWLENEIHLETNARYIDLYGVIIGASEDQENSIWISPDYDYAKASWVSRDDIIYGKNSYHPSFKDDRANHNYNSFKKGDLWIDGTHRAIILERMIQERSSALSALFVTPSTLPIEITKEVSGKIYTIIIDRIEFTTSGGSIDAFLVITDQRSGQKIVFQGLNIGFNPNGTIGNSSLSLASEVEIRISNAAKLILHGTPQTYVAWDCSGFAGMGVDASIEFCREFLTPLDTVTFEPLPASDPTRVQAHFTVNVPAWGEFVANISVDPFAVTKAEQIRWEIEEATLDFSDSYTPELEFPEIYNSPFVSNGVASEFWKGFHLKRLSATLNKSMANDTSEITLSVENMIIDDRGFTGQFRIESNIVSLEEGNLFGWPFSIDTLEVAIVANNLVSGGISGYVNVPAFESAVDPSPDITVKDCFYYKAEMTIGGGFQFVVSTINNQLRAPLFKAGEIVLKNNSSINMYSDGDEFEILAHLNGSLIIQSAGGSLLGLDLDSISFQGFEIANVSPYFSPGIWSMPKGLSINVGGFGASIDKIQILKEEAENEAAFCSDMAIELTGDNLGISASARTKIIGKLEVVDERQKWVFDRIVIDNILLDATIKGNRVRGGLTFYENDSIFGKGFRGILKLDLEALKVEVDALAQFGRHSTGFKYFMVDALVSFEKGLGEGTFKIKGLGGGLYNRMSRDTADTFPIPSSPTPTPSLTALGESLSGIQYLPDISRGIGFKANVVFVSGGVEDAFNGNAGFEIAFNNGGGIAEIIIEGNARFMSEVDFGQQPFHQENATLPPLDEETYPLSAYVKIKYDFNNSILDGDLNVFLNTPTFKGKGENGQMVWAKLYFSKKDWYIHIGKPSNPCGVVFIIPGVGQVGEVTAYLNIGTNMEPMPPLPPEVYELTGAIKPNPRRSSGKGFAFGAAFKFNTDPIKFLILEAQISAGAGFDVLIQDYGNAICYHTGQKPGINGWYASGQVYAYLTGKVSVEALGKSIKVLDLGVAAALQARLPNPVWLHGAFGVRYSVLGGLISGNVKFRFTVGELCELVDPDGTPQSLSVKVIESISPGDHYTEIPTNTDIYVALNYPLNRPQVNEITGKTYSIAFKESEILWEGNEIAALRTVQEDNMAVIYKFYNMLPENDTIHFRITFDIKENGLVVDSESDTLWFVTSERPDVIASSNILYSYPLAGQYNFYRLENPEKTGYIALEYGQPYLFQGADKPDLLLIDNTGNTKELVYTYEYLTNRIVFNLPQNIITPEYLYKLALVMLEEPDGETTSSSPDVNLPGIKPSNAPPLYYNLPETQDLSLSNLKVLCQLVFRASKYSTFHEKLSNMTSNPTGSYNSSSLTLKLTLSTPEILSFHELRDLPGNERLVRVYFEPPPGNWYLNDVYNRTYRYWPGEKGSIGNKQIPNLNRNEDDGIPPFKSMQIVSSSKDIVTEANFLGGSVESGNFPVMKTEAHAIMLKDWKYLQAQLKIYLQTHSVGGPEYKDEMNWLIHNEFTKYTGTHKFRLEYFLPGSDGYSTSRVISFESQ